MLIGHATSLLALDFEKPRRVDLGAARVNGAALGLALGDRVGPDDLPTSSPPLLTTPVQSGSWSCSARPRGSRLAGHVEQSLLAPVAPGIRQRAAGRVGGGVGAR